MPRIEHILFPVDFSEQNCRIATHVACMAKREQALVTVVHVIEAPDGAFPGWPATAIAADLRSIELWKKQRLDAFLAYELAGVRVARVVLEGDPATRIAEYAEQQGVSLIMAPTHGHGAFRRLLLGSVTAKLLHDASCPVWTSAHTEELPALPGSGPVLCATDLGPESGRLLEFAASFARRRDAQLKVAHAIPPSVSALEVEGQRFRAALRERAAASIDGLLAAAGMEAEPIIESGDVSSVIAGAARRHEAGLVVIGRGVMNQTLGRMRTHVYSIVRESPCPVISVPL